MSGVWVSVRLMTATDGSAVAVLDSVAPGPELAAAVAAVDVAACTGRQLVDVVRARYRQRCVDDAQLLTVLDALAHSRPDTTVRRPDGDGLAGREVEFGLTVTGSAARQWLLCAQTAIRRVPVLHAAMLAGDLDLVKVRMFSTHLRDVDDETAREVVGVLRAQFAWCTVGQLRYRLHRLLIAKDPDQAAARAGRAQGRRAVITGAHPHGTATLRGVNLPVEKAAKAWDNVNRIARTLHRAGDVGRRSLDQVRADVFADLLAGVDPHPGSGGPVGSGGVVYLHVNLSTLMRRDNLPGWLEGFGPILADVARQTAAQLDERGEWKFIATDDDGTVQGVGNLRYRPTRAQAAYIHARDQTCRAPGCPVPARNCDIDHIKPYAQGGATTVDNLISVCRAHHRMKHQPGFTVEATPNGIRWTTPRGRQYTVPPPPPLHKGHRMERRR